MANQEMKIRFEMMLDPAEKPDQYTVIVESGFEDEEGPRFRREVTGSLMLCAMIAYSMWQEHLVIQRREQVKMLSRLSCHHDLEMIADVQSFFRTLSQQMHEDTKEDVPTVIAGESMLGRAH